jgi:hypothetical protein
VGEAAGVGVSSGESSEVLSASPDSSSSAGDGVEVGGLSAVAVSSGVGVAVSVGPGVGVSVGIPVTVGVVNLAISKVGVMVGVTKADRISFESQASKVINNSEMAKTNAFLWVITAPSSLLIIHNYRQF